MTPERSLPTTPPTFQDSEKRTWTIKLTLDLTDRVLAETRLDLIPKDCDVSPLLGLLLNERQLGAVLWECVRDQAQAREIDKTTFNKALDGDALYNGWEAVVDSILFFIQSRSKKMALAVLEAVQTQLRFMEANAANVAKTIASKTTDEALRVKLNNLGDQMQQDLIEHLANSAMR